MTDEPQNQTTPVSNQPAPSAPQPAETQAKQVSRPQKAGYAIAIIVNIVVLWVFNNLLSWHIPWLTERFVACLGVLNLSIGATILANLLWLFYDAEWFHELTQLVLNVLAFAVVYSLLRVSPFDFSSVPAGTVVTMALRIAFIMSIVGLIIASIVGIVRFFRLWITVR